MIPGAETALIETFKWIWGTFGKEIVKTSSKSVQEKWKKFGEERRSKNLLKNILKK